MESAITFVVWRVSEFVEVTTWTVTGPAWVRLVERRPSAKLSPTTGIVTVGPPSVPMDRSVRPGWPSLKMITAS